MIPMQDTHIVIQKIPWYWNLNPFLWGKAKAGAGYPNRVFLSRQLIEEVLSGDISVETLGTIEHEKYHLKRFVEVGYQSFKWQYLFSKKFRLEEELAADEARVIFLKKNGGSFNLGKRARLLSGSLYLWMISYEDAYKMLQELWEKS